jgi:hypothetical protein
MDFFLNTVPIKSSVIIAEHEFLFSVFLIMYAYSQNTLKAFYRSRLERRKYLIAFGECATEITAKLEWFFCLRIRQKYLSVHGEHD